MWSTPSRPLTAVGAGDPADAACEFSTSNVHMTAVVARFGFVQEFCPSRVLPTISFCLLCNRVIGRLVLCVASVVSIIGSVRVDGGVVVSGA